MNRMILVVAGMFSASSLLLVDSAIKGTALLVLASITAMILRRDSAATRHLVWLLAMVAMLAVPVLSAMLPQWRVLPGWAGIRPRGAVAATSPPSFARPAVGAAPAIRNAQPDEIESPSASAYQPAAALPDSRPAMVTPEPTGASAVWSWNWRHALPLAWATGFFVLILRLMAARWILWNIERQGTVVWSSRQPGMATQDPIVTALQSVCLQLGISRPVTLLIGPDKTIPVVWGILRCRLLLPAAARQWSGEQLRSVLLHELAHIQRRDTMAQVLTQIACALHWFNPLVWFAAWRLGVERERACDDLVLASGVRPSAYAGHLLDVATALSPTRWTQSCALAMARQSSLEGRLVAVLSENQSRRGVSVSLAAIALAIAAGVAVPIAMLRATEEKPAGKANFAAPDLKLRHEHALALFRKWQANARTDGKIPGSLVGRLGDKVNEFIRANRGDESGAPFAKRMEPLVPRFDAARDWIPMEAAALLDDIAAISTGPLKTALAEVMDHTLQTGAPLPAELASAPWGKPEPNGLRMAWLLEPRAAEHRLDTRLRSRVLFHNSGKGAVVFLTRTWLQSGGHTAHDAKGAKINVTNVVYSTQPPFVPFRLAPGEFIEVAAVSVGVGAYKNFEDPHGTGVGVWVEAKEGDDVTLAPGPETLSDYGRYGMPLVDVDGPRWWLHFITQRLRRELPLPADATERTHLLDRATRELFGAAPTAEETAAFLADRGGGAVEALANRLAQRPGLAPYRGSLQSGATKFRVLPRDPTKKPDDPASNPGGYTKRPHAVTIPGGYRLGTYVQLDVTRRPDGKRIVNEASIGFTSPDRTKPAPKPYEIKLPDGYGTWAAAWVRDGNILWVLQKGNLRSYDFANPAHVKEEVVEPDKVPAEIREALRAALKVDEAPKPAKEGADAKLPDDALWKTKVPFEKIPVTITNWSAEKNGLRIGMRVVADEGWRIGGKVKVEMWLHNPGAKNISFNAHPGRSDVGLVVAAKDSEGQDHWAENATVHIIAIPMPCVLPAGHVAKVKDFTLSFDAPDNKELAWFAPKFRKLQPGKYKLRCVWADAHPSVSSADAWTGKLTTSEVDFTLAALGAPQPSALQPATETPK